MWFVPDTEWLVPHSVLDSGMETWSLGQTWLKEKDMRLIETPVFILQDVKIAKHAKTWRACREANIWQIVSFAFSLSVYAKHVLLSAGKCPKWMFKYLRCQGTNCHVLWRGAAANCPTGRERLGGIISLGGRGWWGGVAINAGCKEWWHGIISLGGRGWWQVALLSGLIYLRERLFGVSDRPLPQWPRFTRASAEMEQDYTGGYYRTMFLNFKWSCVHECQSVSCTPEKYVLSFNIKDGNEHVHVIQGGLKADPTNSVTPLRKKKWISVVLGILLSISPKVIFWLS